MRRLLQVTIICLVLLAAGCAQQSPPSGGDPAPRPDGPAPQPTPPVLTAQSFFPIKAGSTWTYQGQGNEYAAFTRESIFSRDNRGQFKESNGGTVSSAVFEANADAVTRVYFQGEQYQPDNLLNSPNFAGNDSTVVIKAPLVAGTTWTSGNMQKKLVSVEAAVDTPAGKFEKCLQIETRTPESVVTEYYKENVGLVKREFKSGDTVVTSTLAQYQIAP